MRKMMFVVIVLFGACVPPGKSKKPSTPTTFEIAIVGGTKVYDPRVDIIDMPSHSKQGECFVAGLEPSEKPSNAGADALAIPQAYQPGEKVIRTWNGSITNFCDDPEYAAPGIYTARVCYFETQWGEQSCLEDVQFSLGSGATLQFEIDFTAESDESFTVVMVNETADPIFVQEAAQCEGNAWFGLQDENGFPVEHNVCGLCDCREGTECVMGCALACAIDSVVELQPGDEISLSLPKVMSRVYTVDDNMCTRPEFVDQSLQIAGCYSTTPPIASDDEIILGDIVCQSQFVVANVDEQRIVIN